MKLVEDKGIVYIGVDSKKQIVYRAGRNIILSSSSKAKHLLRNRWSASSLADILEKELSSFYVCGRNETIAVEKKRRKIEKPCKSLDQMVSCNQFGFVSSRGTKTLYDPSLKLTKAPEEYSGLFSRTAAAKKDINDRVYKLFKRLLRKKDKRLLKRLVKGYISCDYGILDSFDFRREMNAIETKLKGRRGLGIITGAQQTLKDLWQSRQTEDIVIELPQNCSQEQRRSYSDKIGKRLDVQTRPLKYIRYITIRCGISESTRVMQAIQEEFHVITGNRSYHVRRAIPYFIPEMIKCVKGDDIVIQPIRMRRSRKKSGELWNLVNIGAYQAQESTKGKGVKVGVIDTGIDYGHEELSSAYKGGYNFIDFNDDPLDGNGHGTHVSGTVSGRETGVAPGCSVYALKVLSDEGYGTEASVNHGIEWCIDNGIDVINMSLGSPYASKAEEMLCKKAADSGILVCAAAGNEGRGNSYPAAYHGVISVAAVDCNNNHASFSNICDTLDISAPGVDIYSCWPGDSYNIISGTSMATPHVAGVCALAVANFGSSGDVENMMKDTADELGESRKFGAGLVRADNLIYSNEWRGKNGRIRRRRVLSHV